MSRDDVMDQMDTGNKQDDVMDLVETGDESW